MLMYLYNMLKYQPCQSHRPPHLTLSPEGEAGEVWLEEIQI